MSIVDQVKQAAISYFLGILYSSADHCAPFRAMVSMNVDGTVKPLLLVGTAHGKVEDGHCLALLNPDESLANRIVAGCGYNGRVLKEIVAKRCDVALDIWIDAYKPAERAVTVMTRYKAQHFQPARFVVR